MRLSNLKLVFTSLIHISMKGFVELLRMSMTVFVCPYGAVQIIPDTKREMGLRKCHQMPFIEREFLKMFL